MSKKSKLLLCVIGIFLVTGILIGISYAYYIFSVSQSGSNVVRTDCFEITYTDGNAINLSDTIPLTDKEAKELDPYTFTIKNICNQAVDYSVNIETLEGSTMNLDAVATKLDGKKKQILGQLENNSNLVNSNATSSKTIYSYILKAGEEKTHNLRLWVDEDATLEQSMSKSYSSKVVVNGVLHPNYKEAILMKGQDFNKKIKELSGDANPASYSDNTSITLIQRSFIPPLESDNAIDVSLQEATGFCSQDICSSFKKSDIPIYAWFKEGIIYLYCENDKIIVSSGSEAFRKLKNVESVDLTYFDTSRSIDISHMFSEMNSITNLDVSDIDTSKVLDMSYMFYNVRNLTSLDLSSFDTSNVTSMSSMFSGMNSITNLDVSNFDTSNVTSMSGMFSGMSSLTNLDVSNFDTSNVTYMEWMFSESNSLTNLDLSIFDTSNVTDMRWMFGLMNSLTNLDVSNFDTSNVTSMYGMFAEMSSLTSLDISNFDTSNVTDMRRMLYGMSSVSKIYVGNNWSVDNVSESSNMFQNCSNLVGGAGTTYDSSHIDKGYAVIDCGSERPGYLTYKGPIGSNAAYCASIGYDYIPDE